MAYYHPLPYQGLFFIILPIIANLGDFKKSVVVVFFSMSFIVSSISIKFTYLQINGYIGKINIKINETVEDYVKIKTIKLI